MQFEFGVGMNNFGFDLNALFFYLPEKNQKWHVHEVLLKVAYSLQSKSQVFYFESFYISFRKDH